MKFKLIRQLENGEYYCDIELTEFNAADQKKASIFGYPKITIKNHSGGKFTLSINVINNYSPYGWTNQDDADDYSEFLKKQINDIKIRWESLEDTWSTEEEL